MAQVQKEHLKEVTIVIPIYKQFPAETELRSLKQCLTILASYPIAVVYPQGLSLEGYLPLLNQAQEVSFINLDPKHFTGVKSYSKLLVSKAFYQLFAEYAYLLIYQLDAWVFRDELSTWCRKGFDYIGAPWLSEPPASQKKRSPLRLSQLLVRRVGNGGFSLRKVSTHIRWSRWTQILFLLLPKNEDLLWSLFVPLHKPSYREALCFAFEVEPRKSLQLTEGKLPFGCHGWEKYEKDFWHSFIP